MRTHPRSLQELVDEHVRRYELERRGGRGERRAACIALSRQPGSGGEELGHDLATELGFDFFGIEIVDQIAREKHVQRELVAGLDEHVRSLIDRYVLHALQPFDEGDYLRGVARAVTTIAERGRAVFLGRGAVFILPPDRALRVLVVAPRELRIERVAKRHDLAADDAARQLEREDEERLAFHRHHFDRDPDDASFYDLVLNTGTLGAELALALAAESWRRKFGAAG